MRYLLVSGFCQFFLCSHLTFAHTIGAEDWCLLLAPNHQECIYMQSSACEEERKHYKTGEKKVTKEILAEKFEKNTNPQLTKNFQFMCIPNFRKNVEFDKDPLLETSPSGRSKRSPPY